MAKSPIRSWLYRSVAGAVICALLSATPYARPQSSRKAKESGPRAVGLLELSADGTARLIPIAIMVDGKFYDASAYKASPVPFAIWGQTVYEAERTGVSQGLFTVGEVLQSGKNWIAEGKWRPAGSEPAKKHQDDAKPRMEEEEGPPKLRRPEAEKPAPPVPASAPAEAKAPPATSAPAEKKPARETPTPAKPSDDTGAGANSTPSFNTASNDEDPNRPVLQRGKTHALGPGAGSASSAKTAPATSKGALAKTEKEKKNAPPQLIPAISDAGGPDPRPYSYDIKPDEELNFRKKMLALATEAVLDRAKQIASVVPEAEPATRPTRSTRSAVKAPQPSFDDVQFRAFDLWNTNEPVFVLTAKAHVPKAAGPAETADDLTYFVTLVDKLDIYGDLRKLNSTVTDTRHLDEFPRLELIDAVDADGDGRGELLFRQLSDAGSAWAIYRAGADQLFPLFQGTP